MLNCILLFKFHSIYFWTVYSSNYLHVFIYKRRNKRSWLITCNQVVCLWLHCTNLGHLPKMYASPIPGHSKWQSSLTNYIMYCRVVSSLWITVMKNETMSNKEFDTFSLFHTVSCTGKHYFTTSYESLLILTILYYIV